MHYVVVGAGRDRRHGWRRLVRDGHDVLLCDADPSTSPRSTRDGLRIEGPVEQLTVARPAVTPDALPDGLGRRAARGEGPPHRRRRSRWSRRRLAPDGLVVSLQNGFNERRDRRRGRPERIVGAFVNFGADDLAPGRIMRGNAARSGSASSTARDTERVRAARRRHPGRRATDNILGYLWAKEAYGAMLFATAVSDLSIADALAEPRYRPLFVALAREVLAAGAGPRRAVRRLRPGRSRGVDRAAGRLQPRSAKSHTGIYRDLAVRHRPTEVTR